MNRHFDHVIFDFDGTLVDSAPAILSCFRDVLDARGLTPCVAIDDRLISPPLVATLARISGLDDGAEVQRLADEFKRRYDQEALYRTLAYPGIEEELTRFLAAGYRLHIATNKRARPTELILDHLGLARYFDTVYTIDRVDPPYAHKAAMISAQLAEQGLRAESACYIGDKAEDGQAADANGLAFYFVGWGYGEWEPYRFPVHWHLVPMSSLLCEKLQSRKTKT